MKDDLFIVLTVTSFETILNLVVILLLAGERGFLDFTARLNIVRFAVCTVLICILSYIFRPLAPNVIVNSLFHVAIYIVAIMLVYRIGIYRAVFCTLILLFFFASFENIYVPYIMAYISKGYANFFSNDITIFLCSLPERILWIGVIIFLWKHHIIFITARLNKRIYILLTVILISASLAMNTISLVYVSYFNNISLAYQMTFSVGLLILGVADFLLIKLLYELMKWSIERGTARYMESEYNLDWLIKKLNILLYNNEYENAKKLLRLMEDDDFDGALGIIETLQSRK